MPSKDITNSNGELIKKRVIFAPPPHDAVVRITSISNDLVINDYEVVKNGGYVLVKGYLNKSIVYNTTNKGLLKKLMGIEDESKDSEKSNQNSNEDKDKNNDKDKDKDKKGVRCEPVFQDPKYMAIDGVVRHTTVWIPVEILIETEGAEDGDFVSIVSKSVKALNNDFEILEEGLLTGLLVNDVVTVTVSVTKQI